MPDNSGLWLLGLGALLFLGRGGAAKPRGDDDNRLIANQRAALPRPPAFDLRGYIDSLFATVPAQPPIQLVGSSGVVVTSSGVPGINTPPPGLITPTTKVMIGGDGGETITDSALAIKRSEQIKQQQFEYAANVQPRNLAKTVAANQIEEARQKKYAADLIARRVVEQADRNARIEGMTREQQEAAAVPPVVVAPPTINYNDDGSDEEGLAFGSTAGQPIVVDTFTPSLQDIDVDFSSEGISGDFVISGGLDSPAVFAGEEEDTYTLAGVQDYGYGVYYGGSEDE